MRVGGAGSAWQWQLRYFTLDERGLRYQKAPEPAGRRASVPYPRPAGLRLLNVDEALRVELWDDDACVLRLVGPRRAYYLRAASPAVMGAAARAIGARIVSSLMLLSPAARRQRYARGRRALFEQGPKVPALVPMGADGAAGDGGAGDSLTAGMTALDGLAAHRGPLDAPLLGDGGGGDGAGDDGADDDGDDDGGDDGLGGEEADMLAWPHGRGALALAVHVILLPLK